MRRIGRQSFARTHFSTTQRGFTLVELIVVAVLTSILMAALAGTMTSILRMKVAAPSSATRAVRKQIQRDLMNAVYFRFSDGRLDLLGPISLDATMQPVWQDAEVSYMVKPTMLSGKNETQKGLLIRSQRAANESVGPPDGRSRTTIEPIWLGVSDIRFDTNYVMEENASGLPADLSPIGLRSPGPNSDLVPQDWKRLPPTFRVQIFSDKGRVWLSESIVGAGT